MILKETSPAAVAIGFAEYLARSISIESYLQSAQKHQKLLLTEPVPEQDKRISPIADQLSFGLPAMVLVALAVAQNRGNLALSVLVGTPAREIKAICVVELPNAIPRTVLVSVGVAVIAPDSSPKKFSGRL